jgi:hypothetical protein
MPVAALAAAALLIAPAAQAAPAQPIARPASQLPAGTVISPKLFGMHIFNLQNGVWPTVPVGSVRLWDNQTTWSSIEKAQDNFDWTTLDNAVATARKNGVTDILMVLAGTPSWATDDPSAGGAAGVLPGAAGMPTNFAWWDDWVRQVATRYKGQITAYQPWNEANLSTFSTGSPQEMADLTKRAYDIIKQVDPSATVVAPSTGTRLAGPFRKFYPAFLRELGERGWPVDVFSAHTYPASVGTPVDRAALATEWEAMLAAAGAPNLPLWDTENNFGLAGPGPTNPDTNIEGVKAAQWTARTYLDALRLGISRAYWYAWGPRNELLGIQMDTGTPAATAYATLQKWIVGSTFEGCQTRGRAVTCNFERKGEPFQIVYSDSGAKERFKVARGTAQKCDLNGTCKALKAKKKRVATAGPLYLGP